MQLPPENIAPVYAKLKDLHLTTPLVSGGQATARIVAPDLYRDQAARLQKAVQDLTGVALPIVRDDAPEVAVPIRGNLILLGNRSTNRTIEELYNRYFTLLDLRYPGPEGYEVRTLHNPFGGGHNAVFAGGSDVAGVDAATDALIEVLRKAGGERGRLSVGWLMEIRLGKGITVPTELTAFETWEASAGYGSIGYFGWNSISKRMAMYYMTGDPLHAREALRLSFPDERAFEEITRIDEERIEDKRQPLSGPYHYNTHMMILFWDLIEESPVFSDEERLRVTNAFSRQFAHPQEWGWRRQIHEKVVRGEAPTEAWAAPPAQVGSRHGQWSAIGLFCLGRYFQRDYSHLLWDHCVAAAKWHFSPLHEHTWVAGEHDNLFWYNTGMAPILTYMLLTGDRRPFENGGVKSLLRGQDILASGRQPDWALRSGALDFFHKAAYLTRDGRWLLYRQRTGVDVEVFRLGQSFWPEERLAPAPPEDLMGRWGIQPLPEPLWRTRKTGFSPEESFFFGSFRSATDASGDFVLIKGFNGASRNPYHTFTVLELRLNGYTLLRGYRNQVQARLDGLVEPHIAMDAALRHSDVTGGTAIVTAEVPDAAFCAWRRTLVQRTGRYALFVDDLTFRSGGDGMEVEILFETEGQAEASPDGPITFKAPTEVWDRVAAPARIWPADRMRTTPRGKVITTSWMGSVRAGERRTFFSLVGLEANGCLRLSDRAAILEAPGPALSVAGGHAGVEGELTVVAGDHLYGRRVTKVALDGTLLKAGAPVDVDWDFEKGVLHIVASKDIQVEIAAKAEGRRQTSPPSPLPEGEGREKPAPPSPLGKGAGGLGRTFSLSAGRHCFEGVFPDADVLKRTRERLEGLLKEAKMNRDRQDAQERGKPVVRVPPLSVGLDADVGGKVLDLVPVSMPGGTLLYAAEGQTVHVLGTDGKEVRRLSTDGPVRMLRWWPEHRLLLAGCADEKVIAFDEAGQRQWTFVSEMDPAVFRAAKQYWFKSAPGHEGVHGLHTGVFLDGRSQAFVGSACTLEVLNERGELIRRRAVFWGPGAVFEIVDGPDGGLNLLIGRDITDGAHLAMINNRDLETVRHGFQTVPEGSTYVPGWMSMNRSHIFYEDLDGDGVREVCSEITGSWNRVTVWTAEGKALHDVSFGPGDFIPAKNIRDIDVADLDGDGKKEIVVATSGGIVVALTHRCEKVWAARLDSPATVLKCAGGPWVFAGCEDGGVVVLDGKGRRVRSGRVEGVPTRIEEVDGAVVMGTDKGQVRGFRIE